LKKCEVDRAWSLGCSAHVVNLSFVPIREAPYCQMDAVQYPTPHSVEKRRAPFTPLEPRVIFLLQNRRPNAPDGRAIEEPCPSRVFVSKYLRRKIDKLNFLQPNGQESEVCEEPGAKTA